MSPYRFGSSSTSNVSGLITRFMHAASTICSSYAMSGYSAATARALRMKRPSLIFMMLALWIAVIRLRPIRLRVFEREPRDPRRCPLGDDLQALDHARHDFVLEPRVEVLGVLADDDEIDILEARPDMRQVGDRTQVCVQIQRLPQADVHARKPFADRRRHGPFERDSVAPDGLEQVRPAAACRASRARATPASWRSHVTSTPAASRMRTTASVTSGPMPSPGMRVMACASCGSSAVARFPEEQRQTADGDERQEVAPTESAVRDQHTA